MRAPRPAWVLGLVALAWPVTVAAQNEAPPSLRSAAYTLTIHSPQRATVGVELQVDGELRELLVTWFPGQGLRQLFVSAEGAEVPADLAAADGGAVRRLRLRRPVRGAVQLHYEITLGPDYHYRYALAVPTMAPRSGRNSVSIRVQLPAGARLRGDAFPHLSAGADAQLTAQLGGVPGFVHTVFEGAPAAASGAPPAADNAGADEPAATGPLPSADEPAAEAPEAMGAGAARSGFGLSFYGFFLFSALWCLGYFVWALRANRTRDG